VKDRPDVSPEEYTKYKAYLFNKQVDLNPFDDGKATLPAGIGKLNMDGIHGPEVQFLGKTLSATGAGIPFISALAGAAAGARYGGRKPVRRGFYGGVGGVAVGTVVGNIIESERRRRNTVENELNGELR